VEKVQLEDPVTPLSVLVVDDDPLVRRALAREFRHRGHDVMTAGTYEEALAAAAEEQPELAVVDLRMPDRSGLELVQALKNVSQEIRVVVVTGYATLDTAVDAVHLGATAYVSKPTDSSRILAAIERAENPLSAAADLVGPEQRSLGDLEWDHIHSVLRSCGGNVSEAARRLGLHRRSLQRKLRRPRE
jgi:two-component system response regulator RegA